MPPVRVLKIAGSHYNMGYQHGLAFADDIRLITEERIRLSCETAWTGRNLSRDHVLELAQACIPYHEAYAPDIMAELRGMSDATGIGVAELIIAGGFTDFVDVVYNALDTKPEVPIYGNECTAWLASGANRGFWHSAPKRYI